MRISTAQHPAFSLVEVTLALGVAAVSLLAIFALLPVGIKTNQVAIEQTASTDVLSAIIADLRATPVTSPRGTATSSQQFRLNMPANPVSTVTTSTLFFDSEGRCSTDVSGTTSPDGTSWMPPLQTRYRVTISFLPNGTGTRTATFVDLKATWPAAATIANAGGAAEMFVALDRN